MGGGEVEPREKGDWKKLKDEGLSDEVALQLVSRLSTLEDEIFDCHYTMGLALREKKQLTSKLIQCNNNSSPSASDGVDHGEHDMVKKQINADKQILQSLVAELDKTRTGVEAELAQLRRENENLQVTKEEYKRLTQECKHQHELVLKEREDLKQERERFEKQWELLEEKRAQDLKTIALDKGALRREMQATQEYARKISGDHRMEKEALYDEQEAFEEKVERKMENINYLQEVIASKFEELKLERLKIDDEKQKIAADKQQFEEKQAGIHKDMEKLDSLIKNVRHQRAQFKNLVDKYKGYKNFGEIILEEMHMD